MDVVHNIELSGYHANERFAELEKGVALFYRLIEIMRSSNLLSPIVNKLDLDTLN